MAVGDKTVFLGKGGKNKFAGIWFHLVSKKSFHKIFFQNWLYLLQKKVFTKNYSQFSKMTVV